MRKAVRVSEQVPALSHPELCTQGPSPGQSSPGRGKRQGWRAGCLAGWLWHKYGAWAVWPGLMGLLSLPGSLLSDVVPTPPITRSQASGTLSIGGLTPAPSSPFQLLP